MKYFVAFLAVLISCNSPDSRSSDQIPEIIKISTPSESGGEPGLFTANDGTVYLSWLEYQNDTMFSFQYSKLENDKWGAAHTIAEGSDWFVNWADFPSLVAYEDNSNSLAAHRLEMSADGTYDYDVMVAQSINGSDEWTDPFILHTDGIPAEHGFVSLLPLSEDRIFATWLDGRNTKLGHEESDNTGHGHGHGGGAMTLRAATFDKTGALYDEVELDDRVCDCCQTSAAKVKDGIVVAYRNRTEDEIRDIAVVKKQGDKWLDPVIVHGDEWKFPACPVNGPVIRASNESVAVSWFTMNDTLPEVKVAFSEDNGRTFLPPIKIDHGDPLGRVDLVFIDEQTALASWLERTKDGASIQAIKIGREGSIGDSFEITKTSPSRGSGFPRMTRDKDRVIVAWTEVGDKTKVSSAIVKL